MSVMFTGLIQSLGRIQFLNAYQLRVTPFGAGKELLFQDLAVGDSIAVDGICLTVETFGTKDFTVSVSPETLARTALAQQSPEHWVNLEASLRVGSKVGGHFVSGHVDGLGILEAKEQTATSWWLRFGGLDPAIAPLLVTKGSITVNGISLTVADCDPQGRWFSVAVIPLTYSSTNLKTLAVGRRVHLETDLLGKYVQRLLQLSRPPARPASLEESTPVQAALGNDVGNDLGNDLGDDFLREHGYL